MTKQLIFNHPPKRTPRDYQARMVDRIHQEVICGDTDSFLIASPPGTGKGDTACMIILRALEEGQRVLFLVHKTGLMKDIRRRLTSQYGLGTQHVGYVYGRKSQKTRDVVFSTQLTAYRRLEKMDLHEFDLIMIDEAHRTGSDTYLEVLKYAGDNVKLVGLTGTPWREDSVMLDNFYSDMDWMIDMDEALARGYIVPTLPYAPVAPDLSDARTRRGDFVSADLDRIFLPYDHIVVEKYLELGQNRKAICFCNSVDQASRLVPLFREKGIKAAAIYHGMGAGRKQIELDFEAGRLQVLLNIQVFTEGHDDPPTSCVIWATATQSRLKYVQATMRGIRAYPGKKDCIVIDLGNNTRRHGCVEDFMESETIHTKCCPDCNFVVRETANRCPSCKTEFLQIRTTEQGQQRGPRRDDTMQDDPGELELVQRMALKEKILSRYLRNEGRWDNNEDLVVIGAHFGWTAEQVFEKIAASGRGSERLVALFVHKTNRTKWIQYYNRALLRLAERGLYYELDRSGGRYYFIESK